MSKVVWIFEWPMNSWIAFRLAPESISSEAKVCQHMCRLIGLSRSGSRSSLATSSCSRSFAAFQAHFRASVDRRCVERLGGRATEIAGYRRAQPDTIWLCKRDSALQCGQSQDSPPCSNRRNAPPPRRGVFCWRGSWEAGCAVFARPMRNRRRKRSAASRAAVGPAVRAWRNAFAADRPRPSEL
jgi:hypothetical protein